MTRPRKDRLAQLRERVAAGTSFTAAEAGELFLEIDALMADIQSRKRRQVCNEDAAYRRLLARFWKSIEQRGECWIWKRCRRQDGYGKFSFRGEDMTAHRFAYELAHGTIPAGALVLHSCDNRSCVRPLHLRLGTHRDNMDDMRMRSRQPGKKLDFERAQEIRRLRAEEGASHANLAARFGIAETTVWNVLSGVTWIGPKGPYRSKPRGGKQRSGCA